MGGQGSSHDSIAVSAATVDHNLFSIFSMSLPSFPNLKNAAPRHCITIIIDLDSSVCFSDWGGLPFSPWNQQSYLCWEHLIQTAPAEQSENWHFPLAVQTQIWMQLPGKEVRLDAIQGVKPDLTHPNCIKSCLLKKKKKKTTPYVYCLLFFWALCKFFSVLNSIVIWNYSDHKRCVAPNKNHFIWLFYNYFFFKIFF